MSPSFVTLHLLVSEIAAVYCYNVYCCYCGVFTEMYVHTEFHLDWLLCE